MAYVLCYSLIATAIISLLSLVGILSLAVKEKLLKKILLVLVAFSAGALIGGAFLHLIPEALETSSPVNVFIMVILGIICFFIMERLLYWHHCHKGKCDVHAFTYLNLMGDGIHNFVDGLIIVSTFAVNFHLGVVTTLAIAAHELPQEIGDFAVLLYGGFTKAKALFWNFISALTAIFGVVVGYLLLKQIGGFVAFLLPFAAGGFIYIAMSDLIPELHKEKLLKKSLLNFLFFIIGVSFMLLTLLIH
ncbi:MAG: ZIP family metal transporter [Candidatus Woesearchaeota archaeon]